jgi:transcriptional regulator with XRE-family HTH domain
MGFKENLKIRRLELNMTLEEISKQLNISKPTLQRYESGVISNVPFDKIEKLAEILQVTPSWLMGWSNIILSAEEKILLEKYNNLDDKGKLQLMLLLNWN